MTIDPKKASLSELRQFLGEVIQSNPASGRLWDILTCLRGPDSPSERPDMSSEESSKAYSGRRARKRSTVEVIRAQAFGGIVGGAARYRTDINHVTLPPRQEWDHFDKHVERAAKAMGLEVRIQGKEPKVKQKWEAQLVAGEEVVQTILPPKPDVPSLESMKQKFWIEKYHEVIKEKFGGVEENAHNAGMTYWNPYMMEAWAAAKVEHDKLVAKWYEEHPDQTASVVKVGKDGVVVVEKAVEAEPGPAIATPAGVMTGATDYQGMAGAISYDSEASDCPF